jgi:hypothetical protein
MTVFPFLAYSFSKVTILSAVKESSPEVGSSSSTSCGSVISSTPIAVLFLSPPESPLIIDDPIFVF